MPGDDLRLDAELVDQRAEPHAERLHAHQVDLLLEQPARVVFAKAGRLHQRLGFIRIGVGRERGLGHRETSRPRNLGCCGVITIAQRSGPQSDALRPHQMILILLSKFRQVARYCSIDELAAVVGPLAPATGTTCRAGSRSAPRRAARSRSRRAPRCPPISTMLSRTRRRRITPFAVLDLDRCSRAAVGWMPSRAAALSRRAITRGAGIDHEIHAPAVHARLDLEVAAAVRGMSTTLRWSMERTCRRGRSPSSWWVPASFSRT